MTDGPHSIDQRYFSRRPSIFDRASPIEVTPDVDLPSTPSQHHDDFLTREHPDIAPFLYALEKATQKFHYLDTPVTEWADFYVFPDSETLKSLIRRDNLTSAINQTTIINSNPDIAKRWLQELVTKITLTRKSPRSYPLLSFIYGPIGCGKSTFVKRTLNLYFNELALNKIVHTRIEYRKLLSYNAEPIDPDGSKPIRDYTALLRKTIVCCFFRDVLRHFMKFCQKSLFECEEFRGFTDFARREFVLQRGSGMGDPASGHTPLTDQFIFFLHKNNDVAKSIDVTDGKTTRNTILLKLDLMYMEIWLKYLQEQYEFSFLAFFDGFDAIRPQDMLSATDHRRFFDALQKIMSRSTEFNLLAGIHSFLNYHCVAIVRDITFARLIRTQSEHYRLHDVREWQIAPPSARNLIRNCIRRISQYAGGSIPERAPRRFEAFLRRNSRDLIFQKPWNDMVNDDGLVPEWPQKEYLSPFNGNARNELMFVNLSIRFFLRFIEEYNLFPRHEQLNIEKLLEVGLSKKIVAGVKQHRYRFIEILLYKNYAHFENLLSIMHIKTKSGHRIEVDDVNFDNGFIDNVFNYDPTETKKFAIVSKLRILEILNAGDMKLKTIDQVRSTLGKDYVSDLQRMLILMNRVGFIEIVRRNNENYYKIDDLGKIVRFYLCFKMEYIEHVFHHILLPAMIREKSRKTYYRNPNEIRAWSISSVLNSVILCHWIGRIEDEERRDGRRWNWMAPIMSASVRNSANRMIRRFERESRESTFFEDLQAELRRLND